MCLNNKTSIVLSHFISNSYKSDIEKNSKFELDLRQSNLAPT